MVFIQILNNFRTTIENTKTHHLRKHRNPPSYKLLNDPNKIMGLHSIIHI
jgi:hypothetical protein